MNFSLRIPRLCGTVRIVPGHGTWYTEFRLEGIDDIRKRKKLALKQALFEREYALVKQRNALSRRFYSGNGFKSDRFKIRALEMDIGIVLNTQQRLTLKWHEKR